MAVDLTPELAAEFWGQPVPPGTPALEALRPYSSVYVDVAPDTIWLGDGWFLRAVFATRLADRDIWRVLALVSRRPLNLDLQVEIPWVWDQMADPDVSYMTVNTDTGQQIPLEPELHEIQTRVQNLVLHALRRLQEPGRAFEAKNFLPPGVVRPLVHLG